MDLRLGNCLDVLKAMADNSIDSIVTDPPYGLSFMGKKWDYDVPSVEIWREALRVLKPGGHLLSFAGTRTYHRMAVNIEDAGFEIRDQIMWIYGSGFPKSTDVSKRIDKEAGAQREVIGKNPSSRPNHGKNENLKALNQLKGECNLTEPATSEAKQWQGWGSALKPANEPIVVARKPLEKGLTLAANVLKYGTGALNIDATRIEHKSNDPQVNLRKGKTLNGKGENNVYSKGVGKFTGEYFNPQGRWPANVLLDEESSASLDLQVGDTVSRFFYVAKASKRERGTENNHPTVKPIKLMEYLIKLVTPPGALIMDPFLGSGTTGIAAKNNGFKFIGIEMEASYLEIARKRIEAA